MTLRIAVLISGGGSNMVSLVRSITPDHPGQIVGVVSNVPGAGGIAKAQEFGLAASVVDHKPFGTDRAAFEKELAHVLDDWRVDIVCLAGFMRVLSGAFVSRFEGRMLNIHPSLLPKYRGLHTHQRAIDAGDTEAGCTVHVVTSALDDGPILGQARVPVYPDDTSDTLAARVLVEEHKLYPAMLRSFCDGLVD